MTDTTEQGGTLSDAERTIARKVVVLRRKYGLSQAQIAAELSRYGATGTTQSTVSRIEKEQRPLRVGEAAAYARVFDQTVDSLLATNAAADLLERGAIVLENARQAQEALEDAGDDLSTLRVEAARALAAIDDAPVDELLPHDHLRLDAVRERLQRFIDRDPTAGVLKAWDSARVVD